MVQCVASSGRRVQPHKQHLITGFILTECVAKTLLIILDYINSTLSFFLMRSMNCFLFTVVHSMHTLRHYTTGSKLRKSGYKQKPAIQSLQQVHVPSACLLSRNISVRIVFCMPVIWHKNAQCWNFCIIGDNARPGIAGIQAAVTASSSEVFEPCICCMKI